MTHVWFGPRGRKRLDQPVRSDGLGVIALRGAWHKPSGAYTLETFGSHQPGDAFAAMPVALGGQFPLDARSAIPPPVPRMHGADFLPQRRVGAFPLAGPGFEPGVIAAALDVKSGAELAQGMFRLHALVGFVAGFDGSLKMPTVF